MNLTKLINNCAMALPLDQESVDTELINNIGKLDSKKSVYVLLVLFARGPLTRSDIISDSEFKSLRIYPSIYGRIVVSYPYVIKLDSNPLTVYVLGDEHRFDNYWNNITQFMMSNEYFCDKQLDLINELKGDNNDFKTFNLQRLANEVAIYVCPDKTKDKYALDYLEYCVDIIRHFDLVIDLKLYIETIVSEWFEDFSQRDEELKSVSHILSNLLPSKVALQTNS